jgi:hypothetical protein
MGGGRRECIALVKFSYLLVVLHIEIEEENLIGLIVEAAGLVACFRRRGLCGQSRI